MRLGDLHATTTLFSANLASNMSGGPTHNVDWTVEQDVPVDAGRVTLRCRPAEITLLVLRRVERQDSAGAATRPAGIRQRRTTRTRQGSIQWILPGFECVAEVLWPRACLE